MVVIKFLNFFFITLTYHNLLKIELFCIVFYQFLMYYLYFHVNKLDSIIYNKNKHMKKIDCNHMNHRHGVFCNLPSSPNFRTRDIPYFIHIWNNIMSKFLQSGPSKTYLMCPFFKLIKSPFFKKKLHGKNPQKTEFFTA